MAHKAALVSKDMKKDNTNAKPRFPISVYIQIVLAILAFALLVFLFIKSLTVLFIALTVVLAGLFVVMMLQLSMTRGKLNSVGKGVPLTSREQEVFDMLLGGKEAKEIAINLNITPSAVYIHIQNINKKFDVHSTTELLAKLAGLK